MSARIKLISAEQYLKLLKQKVPRLVTLDCSWYPSGKDGFQEYEQEHIAGARYFHFAEVKTNSKFPHMMPKNFEEFNATISKQGIKQSDLVVVYDQATYLSAPRAAWLLSTFGHSEVFLLDNYKEYKKLGGPTESGPSPTVPASTYAPEGAAPATLGKWLNYEDIVKLLESGEASAYNIIDARGSGRFTGAEPEPRPGIQSGHIIGSKNIPFADVVNSDGHFKSKCELQELFKSRGVDPQKPSIILCGSGVTACVVKAASDEAFGGSADIYDGSWSEWGQIAPANFIEK